MNREKIKQSFSFRKAFGEDGYEDNPGSPDDVE